MLCLSQEAVTLTTATRLQLEACNQESIDKMVIKGEMRSAHFISNLLTRDAIMSLEPGQAWVSLLHWGWLTEPGRVPLGWPFKGLHSPIFWMGPESCVASRPQGIWRQGSAGPRPLLGLGSQLKPSFPRVHWPLLGWGSQLKPCSWGCSLLALTP